MNQIDKPDTYIEGPLYQSRTKVYPQAVSGRFRRIKWGFMAFALGLYYLLPFMRWDRGPGAPNQAVLVDLPHRRFYFFFIELWPQEVYYFTGLLIIASLTLFLMNAVAGRVWCGYMCPQTVWTDLFYAIERWVEGDRRDRMRKDRAGLTARRVWELGSKHALWLAVAWWTGGAWVLYFDDAPTLVRQLLTFQAPMAAYAWIAILTASTYLLAGYMREQVCVYMCPWPRIQAALTDEWALNVMYRGDRGEPRISAKKAAALRAKGEPAGDCVDCRQCVAVCPTGVDIRDGAQLGCIQCGLCIDACDNIMRDLGRPSGLIAYDNDMNADRRRAGLPRGLQPGAAADHSLRRADRRHRRLHGLCAGQQEMVAASTCCTTAIHWRCNCRTARCATATRCACSTRTATRGPFSSTSRDWPPMSRSPASAAARRTSRASKSVPTRRSNCACSWLRTRTMCRRRQPVSCSSPRT